MDPSDVYSNINHSDMYKANMGREDETTQDLFLDTEGPDDPRVVQASPSSTNSRKRKKR